MDADRTFTVEDLWRPEMPLPARGVLLAIARRCGTAWEMPRLADQVRIAYNPKLRTTLGRAVLESRLVELNTCLLVEHPDQLVETLVHELAHVAVYIRYGPVPPHGRHFRTVMRAVGLSPRATHDLPVAHLRRRRERYLYLHRCSECGDGFIARRVRRDVCCRACGPEMTWDVFRAAATAAGRDALKGMQHAATSGA